MSALIDAIGWTLLHSLWQAALIGVAAAALLALLRGAAPTQRYLVSCAALLACVLWPLAGLLSRMEAAGVFAADAEDTGLAQLAGVAGGWLPGLQAHLGLVVGAWLLCVGGLLLRTVLGMLWIERAVRQGACDPAWQVRLTRMAQGFGITRAVRLRVVAPRNGALASPLTAGWWRPVVLVPAALVAGMPPDLLEALLAHELAHVRRHDYLVNLLQNAIEILLFYHPAVWWLSRRIRAERELIADDLAAAHSKAPRRLAQALSELEKAQFAAPSMAMQACGGDLATRIRRLVQPPAARSDWKAPALVLALLTAGLFGAAHANGSAGTGKEAVPQVKAIVDFSTCAKPEWSQADLEAEHTGTVTLRFLIAADGRVTRSQVLKSSGYPGLDQAARVGIEKCRFKPGSSNGKLVASWVRMQYVWVLQ